MVEKAQEIGRSGMTGLAQGDHLHFTQLINGQMVNPVEWWDAHWIQDRILPETEGMASGSFRRGTCDKVEGYMSRIYRVLACVLVLAGLAALQRPIGASRAEPSSPAAAPDAKKVDDGTAATLKGKVVLEGTAPGNPIIKMTSDPASRQRREVRAESYLVDNGALQNVFVHIKDGLGNKYIFDTPTEPVKLDQKSCHYVPHVVGVRVDAAARDQQQRRRRCTTCTACRRPIASSTPGQVIAGIKNTVSFTAPEVMIPFKCDVHSWMNAYIGVVSHPYFAVTDKAGTFELKTVPPGTYTIEAWHEKLGRQTQRRDARGEGHEGNHLHLQGRRSRAIDG